MTQSVWLKGTIIATILLMVLLSVFLYFFLFRYDPLQFQAPVLPIPQIDQENYKKIYPSD